MNEQKLREEFYKHFGMVFEYEEEHTDWWLKVIADERARLVEEIEKLIRVDGSNDKMPNELFERAFNIAYNSAVQDGINILKRE